MAEVRKLTIPGRYGSIPQITHFVSEAATAAGLTEKENFHCQMSVDEACTNVIEHAYGGDGNGEIRISCIFGDGNFRIEIEDEGQPFDPTKVPKPSIVEDVENLEPGGIGMHLMYQLMDDVNFYFQDGRNLLVMIKKHESRPDVSSVEVLHAIHLDQGITLASPHGRLNSSAAPELEQGLRQLLQDGHKWLVVDMEAVEYISSRGLKTFVNVWKQAQAEGGDMVFGAMVPTVYETFDVVGFTQIFDIYGSVDMAIDALEKRR